MSPNKAVKKRAAALLAEGRLFAFGLSEQAHGADLYSSEMRLKAAEAGHYRANGSKYYIGNGNEAALVSVFGKRQDSDDYVFFTVDTKDPHYKCSKRIQTSGVRQAFVAAFTLDQYPVQEGDLLATGDQAWDMALNTVNVGKYQLGWASIGICTHAFYEALHHAANRHLYGQAVTDFPHVRVLLSEAYARLMAMKLYAARACDYLRSASAKDRRYLLFNPIQKMKVTMEGETVVELLHQVIAAKGFEQDTYFEMAIRDIGMLPKLEGTVHVNVALVAKFMQNYFFNAQDYPPLPRCLAAVDDTFLLNQGPTRGLGKVTFADYRRAFAGKLTPNQTIFLQQVDALRTFLREGTPSELQSKNMDYMLQLGELFSLVPYAQLIAEMQQLEPVSAELFDLIFKGLVSDLSQLAVRFYCSQDNTPAQATLIMNMVQKPVHQPAAAAMVWQKEVYPLKDAYVAV